jgi:plasmid replication initiation protein
MVWDMKLVVKHNAAIKAAYRLSLDEQRLMILCITKVMRSASNNRQFSLCHAEYCKEFNTSYAYRNMRDAARRLQQRIIEINEEVEINNKVYSGGSINVLSAQYWQESEGEILLEFSENFMPYLQTLSKNFTKYGLADVAGMKSTYSIRFYELLKMRYEQQKTTSNKPCFTLEVDEIRSMFKLKGKYKAHKDLRKYVIDKAISEINSLSPLSIEVEQVKKGRRIHAIKFFISKKATSLELKNTKNKRAIEKAIAGLKEAFTQKRDITLLGKKVIDINGSIISFDNNTSSNIYMALVESDARFIIE